MCKAQSSSWNQQHVGALCSAVANRQWAQARLAEANLATPSTSRACRLCVAHGLCDRDTSDRRFAGTLVHRLWICQVTEPQRQKLVPAYLLTIVRNLLRDDGTLPPSHVLLYTRALHRSLEPQVAQPPDEGSFEWNIKPPADRVPYGLVYADGSRLYAEHKYCNPIAR